nr:hypothetical protein [Tanacetum cinerariifolium]
MCISLIIEAFGISLIVVRGHGVGGNFYFLGLLSGSLFGRVLVMETRLLCGSTSGVLLVPSTIPFHLMILLELVSLMLLRFMIVSRMVYGNGRMIDGIGKQFLVHNVWESIRPRDNLVPWYDLVWFHACIPRHAFNIWLIFKQRLRTQDCLRSWEVAGLGSAGPSLASITSSLMPIAKRKSSKSCIGKLVLAAAAYFRGFSFTNTVADLVSNGAWSWLQSWLLKAPDLGLILTTRESSDVVSDCLVSHNIPRHAFHLWLVMRNGLKTHDKMRQWDVSGDTDLNLLRCALCDNCPDSHMHLFFECTFSAKVWNYVRDLAAVTHSSGFDMTLSELLQVARMSFYLLVQFLRYDRNLKSMDTIDVSPIVGMDVSKDSFSKDYTSSLLESVKANSLTSKISNIDGKFLPRRYTTYQEPLKDAGLSKSTIANAKEKGETLCKPSFASVIHEKPQKMIIKIKEIRNEVSVNGAAVTIPMEAVESVNSRFVNTLYGYFIGDRLVFPLAENYVKNTWAKYGAAFNWPPMYSRVCGTSTAAI